MEERKIIKSGPGSYVVTLPIKWVKKNKLEKGDLIYSQETSNNTIVVAPKLTKVRPEEREIIIGCDALNVDEIDNSIISAYLNNVSSVTFIKFDRKQADNIKHYINLLPGLEVVEETLKRIVAKDILDLKKISIHGSLRRIDIMIRSLLIDTMQGQISTVDIMGQYLFVLKALKLAVRDPNALQTIDLSIEDVMDNLRLMPELENIADRLRNINLMGIKNNEARVILKLLEKHYLNSMRSFYKYDRKRASTVFANKKPIKNRLIKLITKKKSAANINLYNECLSLEKSCRCIARIAFDRWKK